MLLYPFCRTVHFHFFSAEFTLSLYTFNSFQQNSLFLFTLLLLFSRIYSFSLHFNFFSTECTLFLYTFTSFLHNLIFLFIPLFLFYKIYSFSLHFHFFSAEFTLSFYTFTSFQQNSLFFFTLPFCGFYCFAFPRICQTKMILQRMYCSQQAERFNYSNYCILLTTLQIIGPNLMILNCLPSTQIYRRSLNSLASVLGFLGLLIVQNILLT